LKKKWLYVVTTGVFLCSLLFLRQSAPTASVLADEVGTKIFMPLIERWQAIYMPLQILTEAVLFDDFEDEDPVWTLMFAEEPKDGYFEHLDGQLAGHIRDNSARMVVSPGWRPAGDFVVEVDASHDAPDRKTFNGLGIAFCGDDAWYGYYALLLSAGGAQHSWALVRLEGGSTHYMINDGFRGTGNYVKGFSGWNHLEVVRIGDVIRVYINGRLLPNGQVTNSEYGRGRLVGLTVTSYEFDEGEVRFDNFKLTPLYSW
jgi:hypothetical protein